MVYCPNCGAPVEGRFCAKCGAAVGPAPAGGTVPPANVQSIGMDENIAGALCYIPIVGLIFLLIDPYKQNRTIRFHAWQSLLYLAAYIVLQVGLRIVGALIDMGLPFLGILWSVLMGCVGLAYLAGLVLMAVKAYQKSALVLPVIGPLAQKQAG